MKERGDDPLLRVRKSTVRRTQPHQSSTLIITLRAKCPRLRSEDDNAYAIKAWKYITDNDLTKEYPSLTFVLADQPENAEQWLKRVYIKPVFKPYLFLFKFDPVNEPEYPMPKALPGSSAQRWSRYTLAAAGIIGGMVPIAGGVFLIATSGGAFGWGAIAYGLSAIAPYLLSSAMLALALTQFTLVAGLISMKVAQFLNRHMQCKRALRAFAFMVSMALIAAGIAALLTGFGAPAGLLAIGIGLQIISVLLSIFTRKRDPYQCEIDRYNNDNERLPENLIKSQSLGSSDLAQWWAKKYPGLFRQSSSKCTLGSVGIGLDIVSNP